MQKQAVAYGLKSFSPLRVGYFYQNTKWPTNRWNILLGKDIIEDTYE